MWKNKSNWTVMEDTGTEILVEKPQSIIQQQ